MCQKKIYPNLMYKDLDSMNYLTYNTRYKQLKITHFIKEPSQLPLVFHSTLKNQNYRKSFMIPFVILKSFFFIAKIWQP